MQVLDKNSQEVKRSYKKCPKFLKSLFKNDLHFVLPEPSFHLSFHSVPLFLFFVCFFILFLSLSTPLPPFIIFSLSSPDFWTLLPLVSPRDLSVAELFCSRWSTASHLCCLCGAVICLRAGFVRLPVWGQAWWAPMTEIVFFCCCFSQTHRTPVLLDTRSNVYIRSQSCLRKILEKLFYMVFIFLLYWFYWVSLKCNLL